MTSEPLKKSNVRLFQGLNASYTRPNRYCQEKNVWIGKVSIFCGTQNLRKLGAFL